jgi:hypothetical protein
MTAQAFRKKPIEIQAIRARDAFAAAKDDWDQLPDWLAEAYAACKVLFLNHPARIEIHTLEGTMTARMDDWIVRGVLAELYPVKPDIFQATYEPVEG